MPLNSKVADGSTKRYRDQIRQAVSKETAKEIERISVRILQSLPNDERLGNLTAGLMLAATAFAEGAFEAQKLIEDFKP